ncbi:MAG: hypothetical protein IPH36_17105 [Saprospiraceae bacterium]|nr:hypothetical protein [Saprospiraceae bacterium]
MKLVIKYCFFVFGVILFFSCEKKERTELSLEEKVLYDSLKSQAFKDIRSKTDAICANISDSLLPPTQTPFMRLGWQKSNSSLKNEKR